MPEQRGTFLKVFIALFLAKHAKRQQWLVTISVLGAIFDLALRGRAQHRGARPEEQLSTYKTVTARF